MTGLSLGAEDGSRLDRYRDRVAALSQGQHLLGYLRVLVQPAHEERDGPLWRRRWSGESVQLQVRFLDHDLYSRDLGRADLDAQLKDWERGRHRHDEETYLLRWLDSRISHRLAIAWFTQVPR